VLWWLHIFVLWWLHISSVPTLHISMYKLIEYYMGYAQFDSIVMPCHDEALLALC